MLINKYTHSLILSVVVLLNFARVAIVAAAVAAVATVNGNTLHSGPCVVLTSSAHVRNIAKKKKKKN